LIINKLQKIDNGRQKLDRNRKVYK